MDSWCPRQHTFRTGMYSVHLDLSPSVLRSWLLLGQAVVKSNHMTVLSNSEEHLLSNQRGWQVFGLLVSCCKSSAPILFQELVFSPGTPPVSSILRYLVSPQELWGCSLWAVALSLLSEQRWPGSHFQAIRVFGQNLHFTKDIPTDPKAHVPLQTITLFKHPPSPICFHLSSFGASNIQRQIHIF